MHNVSPMLATCFYTDLNVKSGLAVVHYFATNFRTASTTWLRRQSLCRTNHCYSLKDQFSAAQASALPLLGEIRAIHRVYLTSRR